MSIITVPSIDDGAPDELKRRAAKLESLVTKRDARLEKQGASLQALRETPLEIAGVMRGEQERREQSFDELAVELGLRRDVQHLAAEHRAALSKLGHEAGQAVELAKEEIERTLLELGWHRRIAGPPQPCAILPVFILSHPRVHAARERHGELMRKANDRSLEQANAAAIAAIETRIKAARQRLGAA
jgi:hypothetical protein